MSTVALDVSTFLKDRGHFLTSNIGREMGWKVVTCEISEQRVTMLYILVRHQLQIITQSTGTRGPLTFSEVDGRANSFVSRESSQKDPTILANCFQGVIFEI